ncbi:unnamed protein product [Cuscuta europaea]|uniref:Uncharacterized protein n=1 Tax=Cuscuta europaea TaxID=41803 RepID=A0A9P0ZBR6_CUSEU|nr:unnamed protein product [Cuscuta europaea]
MGSSPKCLYVTVIFALMLLVIANARDTIDAATVAPPPQGSAGEIIQKCASECIMKFCRSSVVFLQNCQKGCFKSCLRRTLAKLKRNRNARS